MRREKIHKNEHNKGYTLVEMVIVVAIFAVLLGILAPSLNALIGYRVRRAATSIGSGLDRTREEAMNRLVAEMKLEYREGDGYYLTYYFDRGRAGTRANIKAEQAEKIAPAKTQITYTDSAQVTHTLGKNGQDSLILTYDRATGAFRPIQTKIMDGNAVISWLDMGKDVDFSSCSTDKYCETITVSGGGQKREIHLYRDSGTYEITRQ